MRITICLVLITFLTACGTVREKTEYKDLYVPIPYCPAPPEEALQKPEYYASTLSEEQKNDVGELSKAYVISGKEAIGYANNLELVVQKYKDFSETTIRRIQQLIDMGHNVDDTVMKQDLEKINKELKSLSERIEENEKDTSEDIRKTLQKMNDSP